MTTEQIIAIIEEKIQTGGKRTTAALLREVLSEMANDNDAIIALQALSLISWDTSDLGPPLGKDFYMPGFQSTVDNRAFFRIFNPAQNDTWYFWIDDSGFLRTMLGKPTNVTDGSFIQYQGGQNVASASTIAFGYKNYVGVTGVTTVTRIETAILGAVSGSVFPTGYEVTIQWAGNFTMSHGATAAGTAKGIFLQAGADFVGVTGNVKTFKYNGTDWREI